MATMSDETLAQYLAEAFRGACATDEQCRAAIAADTVCSIHSMASTDGVATLVEGSPEALAEVAVTAHEAWLRQRIADRSGPWPETGPTYMMVNPEAAADNGPRRRVQVSDTIHLDVTTDGRVVGIGFPIEMGLTTALRNALAGVRVAEVADV